MKLFKVLSLALIMSLFSSLFLIEDAESRRRNGYSSRYRTSYRTFSYTVHNYYNYSERSYYSDCGSYLCYEYFDEDPYYLDNDVFVEETIIESGSYAGYTRITVYRNGRYSDNSRIVTYYTHNGRVVRRRFYRRHRYIRDPYFYRGYRRVDYVYLDRYTAEIIVSMRFIQTGALVLANCRNDDAACAFIALASSMSGSIIAAAASEREERRRTALQERIEYYESVDQDDVIDDSWD